MLSLSTDGESIEIKFEVETKFKMAAIAKFCRLTSCLVIQPLAIGILGVIASFVAIIGMAAVSIVFTKSWNAYCFSV